MCMDTTESFGLGPLVPMKEYPNAISYSDILDNITDKVKVHQQKFSAVQSSSFHLILNAHLIFVILCCLYYYTLSLHLIFLLLFKVYLKVFGQRS